MDRKNLINRLVNRKLAASKGKVDSFCMVRNYCMPRVLCAGCAAGTQRGTQSNAKK